MNLNDFLTITGSALTLAVAEGLIYTTGRVSVPAGRWNLANSLVTLSPRLVELAQARLRRQRARRQPTAAGRRLPRGGAR